MPYASCQTCGNEYYREPDEAWKKSCLGCWQARKRKENSAVARLERRIMDLEEELELTRQLLAKAKAGGDIGKFLPFLIFVAHPDRNPPTKKAVATETTKFLLDLRQRLPGSGA